MNKSLDTPILFLIFNRPDATQVVFNQIKKIKPKKFFIAADGPRNGVVNDKIQCALTRKIVDQIDWDCDLKLLFREENLGCGIGVSSAISWFFEHVDRGIILEDDCVPDLSFFDYCSHFLDTYENDERVMMISGTNYLFNRVKNKHNYFFSQYYSIWGWATWKRSWDLYDFNLEDWEKNRDTRIKFLKKKYKKRELVNFWIHNFDEVTKNNLDTWDYQWCYNCIFNNGLSLVPINNLVSNIGNNGVHIKGNNKFLNMPTVPFEFNEIVFIEKIKVNNKAEKISYKNLGFFQNTFFRRVLRYVKRKVFMKEIN